MGMLLRRRADADKNITKRDDISGEQKTKVTEEVKVEFEKNEKPKTVRRGRPTKR